MKLRKVVTLFFLLAFAAVLPLTAHAGGSIVLGDYVWLDSNSNGLQDEDPYAGINGVQVVFFRDYDCNGVIDGADEIFDYDFTGDDASGLPGYYMVPAVGGFCFVSWVEPATVPDGLIFTTDPVLNFATTDQDYLDADFGLNDAGGYECAECDGKITQLTLLFTGADASGDGSYVEVLQGKNKTVFAGWLLPGDTFTVNGIDKKGTLGKEIKIYVDGTLNTKIHTSCSRPVGPGLVSGDFEVVEGYSLLGGRLCPLPPTPPPGEDCACDGKVTQLTLLFTGANPAYIEVLQKKSKTAFAGVVQPGETFTVNGIDKNGTLGTEIKITVDGTLNATIHTSCSRPVGPGLVSGDFEVVEGYSLRGGSLCPL